jgi:histidine ammonia-lyase
VFRCVPQVEGTLLDALDRLGSVLAVEINVAGENALMLPATASRSRTATSTRAC